MMVSVEPAVCIIPRVAEGASGAGAAEEPAMIAEPAEVFIVPVLDNTPVTLTAPANVAASVLLVSVKAVPPVPRPSVRLLEAGEVREGVVTLVRNAGAAAFILRVPLVVPSTAMKSSDAVVVAVVARSLMRMSAIK